MAATVTLPHGNDELGEALLLMLGQSEDIRELAARVVGAVLNELMSMEADSSLQRRARREV
jgi:hypothetical protein